MPDRLQFLVAETDLIAARKLSHSAIQWASLAARANLPARSDDSHSNLGWDEEQAALVSHPLDKAQRFQLGFRFPDGSLIRLEKGAVVDALAVADAGEAAAQDWCDGHLTGAGLKSTDSADLPYELDPVDYRELAGTRDALETLGAWFSATNEALGALVASSGAQSIVMPSVRCWPHHYDLAALFVLEEGDSESTRSVGIGVSPGDAFYDEPYLYCNPWPVPEAALPSPVAPLRWHTKGFTSLVCPASAMQPSRDLPRLFQAAFSTVTTLLQI